jgi:hypothetical protein
MNRLATFVRYSGFVVLGWNAVLVPTLLRSIQPEFRQADAAFGLFFFASALLYAAGSFSVCRITSVGGSTMARGRPVTTDPLLSAVAQPDRNHRLPTGDASRAR